MEDINILFSSEIWASFGDAAKTAAGFFWKSGWAFVLGYFISAMIQAFVPKGRLTPYLGGADSKSVGLAAAFGAISSSCSFAALAAARALVMKGAHFVSAVAFMFASTNLVIELGILILIFLGWQFLAAEIVGGLVLIAISRLLIIWTYPKSWMEKAREKVESEAGSEEVYSDLMVPPLVEINARYYGWRVALYIAGVMYVSIVCTALLLHYSFAFLGITPKSANAVKDVAQFKLDYTFWMNLVAVSLVGWLAWLNHSWRRRNKETAMEMGGGKIKKTAAWIALSVLSFGIIIHLALAVS